MPRHENLQIVPTHGRVHGGLQRRLTQSGATVTCSNASYNGTVPDGGSVTFGFNGAWSGSNPVSTVTLG
ncbi:cellulose binding domain-containing protein [Streptomyces sp. AC550_RSS872]|uniref:cellulose binding domain-containing protein n=1 Tax=Streptomyces sp. AC550_RSS872 TaxID=2823689 RepID=UPI0035ABBAC6